MSEEQVVPTEVVTEAPIVEETPAVAPVDDETLAEAKRQGWKPEEEYDGPDGKWVDADTFVKKGKEINAILRKDNEFLKREVAEMKSTMMEFKKFHDETEKRAYDRAIADLRQQKKDAISVGDGEKVLEIDDALDEIKEKQREAKVQAKPSNQPNPDFVEWNEENNWFGKDTELTEEANLIGNALKQQKPNLIGRDFLDEVTKRVKKMYPEKFTNPNRTKASPVEGTGGSVSTRAKAGKSFADLPPEAKDACLKFEKQKIMTRDQYLKEYFAE